ncbi:UDP-N-acetyl-D-mannosamine dehydrogenase [Basilea psittacipulmonis]|uniref:NDP-N-acetyl-D-galactosaminuronic acid dehydrogenase n=1 Tax=Basilea psittacipulmonis DSM 24701 TaxID=1072685 RepID=A0A077DCF7_9BURK|nr:UDP-N-acetyl-D-mannosamine dehydrogenase [Basilea psittacipulmonis]AIL32289.1 UDP-N-acetyl-D-mannosaminuronic acid dehydrogenase [Basilea psittacipulmonis DSM 24701]
MNKTISVIGLGYIGLPAASMFASKGVKVIGVDINEHIVNTINQGKIHIVEPGLEDLVRQTVSNKYLKATNAPEPADVFLIAVPTPFKENHKPDLSYIETVTKMIAPVLKKGNLIILESTSPVGTTEKMIDWLSVLRPDLKFPSKDSENHDIFVAYCPERVLPGQVINELINNDRIIGGVTDECSNRAIEVYGIFVKGDLIKTNVRTAEMSKLTENAFRDVNIAFANELSLISDRLNIDVWELITLANRHPRVNILEPGCGVGGHCIAVDPWFMVDKTPDLTKIIRTAREVNDSKPDWVIEKVKKAVNHAAFIKNKNVQQVRIVCYGLTFKPDIDDLRESPALAIVNKLMNLYPNQVKAVEPNCQKDNCNVIVPLVEYQESIDENIDVAVLLVNHKEFIENKPNFANNVIVIDTKGIWQK